MAVRRTQLPPSRTQTLTVLKFWVTRHCSTGGVPFVSHYLLNKMFPSKGSLVSIQCSNNMDFLLRVPTCSVSEEPDVPSEVVGPWIPGGGREHSQRLRPAPELDRTGPGPGPKSTGPVGVTAVRSQVTPMLPRMVFVHRGIFCRSGAEGRSGGTRGS